MKTTLLASLRADATASRTYIFAAIFVAGNIIAPQLAHMIPGGGPMLLPIYFFTLIAAYRFGLMAGLVTAVVSPLANHLLFGMPSEAMLAIIFTKSILLALFAGYAGHFTRNAVRLWHLAAVVIAYQAVAMPFEAMITGSWAMAIQDIRVGWIGLLIQVVGGFVALRVAASRFTSLR